MIMSFEIYKCQIFLYFSHYAGSNTAIKLGGSVLQNTLDFSYVYAITQLFDFLIRTNLE